jgi:hypothetical protein
MTGEGSPKILGKQMELVRRAAPKAWAVGEKVGDKAFSNITAEARQLERDLPLDQPGVDHTMTFVADQALEFIDKNQAEMDRMIDHPWRDEDIMAFVWGLRNRVLLRLIKLDRGRDSFLIRAEYFPSARQVREGSIPWWWTSPPAAGR